MKVPTVCALHSTLGNPVTWTLTFTTGPVIKVVSNKVDYFDGSVQENLQDLQELARRAEVESEELQQRDAARAEEAAAQQQGTTKSKKKKIRSENKGNFSSYRNKSFIPNASRVANVDAAAGRSPESPPVRSRRVYLLMFPICALCRRWWAQRTQGEELSGGVGAAGGACRGQ
jgi:hypothetical protein